VTGHSDYGMPFGQDRIVSIFLATLAVQQKSQTIRFGTAAEMLETCGMHKGGKEYRRLIGAFERIFGATAFFATDAFAPAMTPHIASVGANHRKRKKCPPQRQHRNGKKTQ
jgi:hypothetical protein